MKEHKVSRMVVVSSFGVGDSWNNASLLMKPVFYLLLGAVLADIELQETMYAETDLEWTIVRHGGLLDKPGTGV